LDKDVFAALLELVVGSDRLLLCSPDGVVHLFCLALSRVGFHGGVRAVAQRVKAVAEGLAPVSGGLVLLLKHLKSSGNHGLLPPLAQGDIAKCKRVKKKTHRLTVEAIHHRIVGRGQGAKNVEIELAEVVGLRFGTLLDLSGDTEHGFDEEMIRHHKRGEVTARLDHFQ
jgi:hypothetical protein